MAANTSPSKQKEDKEKILTCPICTKSYDNDEHQAKFLPCLHSYCKSCLQQRAGKGPEIYCPKCHDVVYVPSENVYSLPGNYIVENLMTYQDAFNDSVCCGSCKREGTQGVSYCQHCACFLCKLCMENHEQMRPLQHHKILTMDELRKDKNKSTMQKNVYCEKHPNYELTMYCSEVNCQVPICSTCGLIDHHGHTMIELSAAAREIIVAVQQSCATLTAKNAELARKRTQVETMKQYLSENFNQRKEELQESESNLNNLMHAQCSKAHSRIQHIYQNQKENMTKKVKSIDDLSTQMTSACEFANNACEMGHPTQLLTSKTQIINRLCELKKVKLPETETLTSDITFSILHHFLMVLVRYFMLYLWRANLGVNFSSLIGEHRRKMFYKITAGLLFLTCLYQYIAESSYPTSPSYPADPQRSEINLGMPTTQLGYYRATIKIVDSNGHLLTTGNPNIIASQLWNNLLVEDNKDGTYSFTYCSLFGDSLYVRINGNLMKGSPFYIQREVDPNQCTITLHQASAAVGVKLNVGFLYKATLQTVDFSGEKMTTGGGTVKAQQLQFDIDLYIRDNGDGTYEFHYCPHFGTIHVTINGQPMKGSPFSDKPKLDPKLTKIYFSFHSQPNEGTFTVQTLDSNGHYMITGGDNVKATQPDIVEKLDVTDNHDGTYKFFYRKHKGQITVTVNGIHIRGSPFNPYNPITHN